MAAHARLDGGGERTLSTRISDAIGRRIVQGVYMVGEALPPEAMLCAEYGVSRTPLREAIKRLHAKGLVFVGPRAGTRVLDETKWHHLDPDLLRWRFEAGADQTLVVHLYELRHALEPEACRLAALHGSDMDHRAIAAAIAHLEDVRTDLVRTRVADVAFHMSIIGATRNPFMASFGSAVRLLLGFSFNIRTDRTVIPADELAQHRTIADAILLRDGAAAADAMRRLLAHSQRSLTAALARGPSLGVASST